MPIMQVYHAEDALDAAAKEKLAQRLTDVLITMEGGANTWGGRAFAWVLFTPVKAGDWWIGGRRDEQFVHSPGCFLVHVTIPEGYECAAQERCARVGERRNHCCHRRWRRAERGGQRSRHHR
jgi:phenylpyruvate tautomerase PptA (4-oxalocrotonate tautomerase family)